MVRVKAEAWVVWEGGVLVVLWAKFGMKWRSEVPGILEDVELGSEEDFRWYRACFWVELGEEWRAEVGEF